MKFRQSDVGRPVKAILPHFNHKTMKMEDREFDGVVVAAADSLAIINIHAYDRTTTIHANAEFVRRKVRLVTHP